MSLEDPVYGITYFKAIKLDRDVEKIVKRPWTGNNGPSQNIRSPGPQGPQTRRDPPPHMSNNPPPAGGYGPRPPIKCYGCGESGQSIAYAAVNYCFANFIYAERFWGIAYSFKYPL